MLPSFMPQDAAALPLHVLDQDQFPDWLSDRAPEDIAWIEGTDFKAALGQMLLLPGPQGGPVAALAGYGTATSRRRGRFHLASIASQLPNGVYRLDGLPAECVEEEALGWLLSSYRFNRYKDQTATEVKLTAPEGVDTA
ncbi:MAG: leucyl aminopeptidase family protein, partial [Pseudomonadota bacterium]